MRRSYTVWPWLSASAVIAVLIGAGTSFAPLYLDNWGGDARHYMCPMIGGRNVDDPRADAGLCVTPLAWFVIVSALCLLLAVVFAVYCEMAAHLDAAGGLRAGGVMTRSARRARNATGHPCVGLLARDVHRRHTWCGAVRLLLVGDRLGVL